MLNLGINVVVPACDPVNSLTSKTLLLILVTIPRNPLQTPSPGFRFLKIITGCYDFKQCVCIKSVLMFGTEQDTIVYSRCTRSKCFQRSICLMSVPKNAT
jgi:hypothetical protein